LRDYEYDYVKPANTFRILVLGDSFVEAKQIPLDQTFTKVLEQKLNARRGTARYQVITVGVGGWGTDQETLYYENEGYKYQPDVVLVLFSSSINIATNSPDIQIKLDPVNGLSKPYFVLASSQLELKNFPFHGHVTTAPVKLGPFGRVGNWINQHFYLYRFLTIAFRKLVGGSLPSDTTSPKNRFFYGFYAMSQPLSDEWQYAYRLTEAILARLDSSVKSHGSRLVVVSDVERQGVDSTYWQNYLARAPDAGNYQWDVDQPDRLIGGFLTQRGIPFLSLRPIFRAHFEKTRQELNITNELHWNVAGHQLAADAVCDWLAASGWLPQ
jgi:hypothetical protein